MTVAACLIVKNEAAVIGRCLNSVRGLVDAAVVVDTGSTDDTVAVVRGLGLPFPVHGHERPWVHFAHNRTELIRLAAPTADYLLLLDADQTVAGTLPPLAADGYRVPLRSGNLVWDNILLVRAAVPWRFAGVTHEYITCAAPTRVERLTALTLTEHADGARRVDGRKFVEDVRLLEAELARAPGDPRTVFYLARSYDDLAACRPADPQAADWRAKAVARYRERAAMTVGYADEAFYSLFRAGVLRLPDGDGLPLLLGAWERCPHRWEPVHAACRWLNEQKLYRASYDLGKRAMANPPRPVGLFVHSDVYEYLLRFEHSIAAYYVGEYGRSLDLCQSLLARSLPPYVEEAVRRNMAYPAGKLGRS